MSNQEKNLELVKQFQNGDEFAFTQLFKRNQALIMKVVKKFRNITILDEDQRYSTCCRAFWSVCQKYDVENPTSSFGHFAFKGMELNMLSEVKDLNYKGRKELAQSSISLFTEKDDSQLIDLIPNGELNLYFEGKYPTLKPAIDFALSKCKHESMKPYLMMIVLDEYSPQELADTLGESRQVISYQAKKFKEHMKNFIEKEQLA